MMLGCRGREASPDRDECLALPVTGDRQLLRRFYNDPMEEGRWRAGLTPRQDGKERG